MSKSRLLIVLFVPVIAMNFGTLPLHAERLVIMRHGEKPVDDLGQLTCQGLNRALALPLVLNAKFGKPHHIFAPSPAECVLQYSYVRPLATIEPTAISLGLPVHAEYGYTDVDKLAHELLKSAHKDEVIFIAWEHENAVKLMKKVVSEVHGNIAVPDWPEDDFDSLYILDIHQHESAPITLTHDHEGLDGLPITCPSAR